MSSIYPTVSLTSARPPLYGLERYGQPLMMRRDASGADPENRRPVTDGIFPKFSATGLDLLLTCRQMYGEAVEMLYSCNTFIIADVAVLVDLRSYKYLTCFVLVPTMNGYNGCSLQ